MKQYFDEHMKTHTGKNIISCLVFNKSVDEPVMITVHGYGYLRCMVKQQ